MILKRFAPLLVASLASLVLCSLPTRVEAQAGSLDTAFNTGTGTDRSVLAVAVQSDGKILIGGGFTQYNGSSSPGLARLNTNGSLDTSFNVGAGVGGFVYSIAVQGDGKIVIGGDFTAYNGVTANNFARVNTDGSVDGTFNPVGSGADDSVNAIALQSNGQIVIGGDFSNVNGVASPFIARLNTDGSYDSSFNVGSGADDSIYAIAVQSNGQILVGGDLSVYNGTTANSIVRLNSNGSYDTTFVTGNGTDDSVYSIALQSNGQILIGGDFSEYNGTPEARIARLNSNGSVDTSFNVGTGANDSVLALAVQADGSVIVGGRFTSLNGSAVNGIGAVTSGGAVDTSFNTLGGVQGFVNQVAIQPADGNIVIVGGFPTFNGTASANVARILGGSGHPSFFNGEVPVGAGVYYLVFPNGNLFGYYNYQFYPDIYHYDLGFEYVIDAHDGFGGAYFFDFASGHFWYTSPVFPFPYLYDFSLNAFLYYIPATNNPGHYTSNPRYFSNLTTGQIITQ